MAFGSNSDAAIQILTEISNKLDEQNRSLEMISQSSREEASASEKMVESSKAKREDKTEKGAIVSMIGGLKGQILSALSSFGASQIKSSQLGRAIKDIDKRYEMTHEVPVRILKSFYGNLAAGNGTYTRADVAKSYQSLRAREMRRWEAEFDVDEVTMRGNTAENTIRRFTGRDPARWGLGINEWLQNLWNNDAGLTLQQQDIAKTIEASEGDFRALDKSKEMYQKQKQINYNQKVSEE